MYYSWGLIKITNEIAICLEEEKVIYNQQKKSENWIFNARRSPIEVPEVYIINGKNELIAGNVFSKYFFLLMLCKYSSSRIDLTDAKSISVHPFSNLESDRNSA